MSKQTAVEWLKKELEEYGSHSHLNLDWETFDELVEQAKAMEREQMGLPNCKPMDEHIISVTIFDPATGKTYTRENTNELNNE